MRDSAKEAMIMKREIEYQISKEKRRIWYLSEKIKYIRAEISATERPSDSGREN